MNRKTGLLLAITLLLIAAASFVLWPRQESTSEITWTPPVSGPEPVGPGAGYLRGAHWFGEGWAVNFWNTRLLERAAEDFAALREDGFNTVVLVIPWAGFTPTASDGRLDANRTRRLAELVDLAEDAGLNVVLRLGYAWDSSVPGAGAWLMQVWLDETVRQAWLRHIAGIWRVVEDRPNVLFGFISWEDLWAITGSGAGDEEERQRLAYLTGYREWLQRYSDLETVSARYGRRFTGWEQVPVPPRTHPAFGLFFDFVDHAWIERFFKPAQDVFPTLSMEVRIDSDPVWNAPGELAYWHSHELAWDLPGAPWTTVYWAPAMGGENQGETLSPATAAERLAYQMRRLRRVTGDRPIFIDQFLVEDFTPGFEMNGRLAPAAIDDFLREAAPVLRRYTHGYSLWAWRDYRHNAVPSPDFSVLAGNWDGEVEDAPDAPAYLLGQGERLQRSFHIHEFHAPGGPDSAALCVNAVRDGDSAPDLRVHSNNGRQRAELDASGTGHACVDIDVHATTTVALEGLADLELFSVSLSGFTQPTGIRDLEGRPKPIAADWRHLNQELVQATPAPFEAFDDGWMGKTLSVSLRGYHAQGGTLHFRTNRPDDWPYQPVIGITVNGQHVAEAPCTDDQEHEISVAPELLVHGRQAVTLTVDRTFRPRGDERRLGCMVSDLELHAD